MLWNLAEENFDDGNCIVEVDCFGECGGDAVVDECGGGGMAIYECVEEVAIMHVIAMAT